MSKKINDDLLGIVAQSSYKSSYLSGISGMISNPNISVAKAGDKQITFSNILTDTHVAACVQSRKSAVLNYDYEIRCEDEDIAKFCQQVIDSIGYADLINNIMEAVFYGYSVLEIYYWYDNINNSDNLVPNKIISKPMEWFSFDKNGICKFKTMTNPEGEILPYRKFLVVQHKSTYNNPYGEAVLSKCLWPVVFKTVDLTFWLRYIEKFGMPHFVGKIDFKNDATAIEQMQANLDELIQDSSTIISSEEEITSLNPGASGQANQFRELIEYCNEEISKAILSQTMTTELQKQGGSYAASKTHFQVYEMVTAGDVALVKSAIDKLLKWVVELNFEDAKIPEVLIFPPEDVDKPLADVVNVLSTNGNIKFTKEFYKKRFGFNDDEFDVPENTPQETNGFAEKQHKCQCHTSTFASVNEFPDQFLIDTFADKSIDKNQDLFKNVINQVQSFLDSSNNYDEVKENIHQLLPNLETKDIEDKLLSVLFLSQLTGSLSVQQENK